MRIATVVACFAGLLLGSPALAAPVASAPHYHIARTIALPGDGGWDYLALDPDARRLYVTHNTRVQVIDVNTDSLIGEVVGVNGAHGTVIVPALGRGYITSGRDSMLVVFDLKTLAVLDRLPVPARFPDAGCYEPVSRRVLTFNGGSANAAAFDAASGKLSGTIALGGKPEFAVADGHGLVFVNNEDSSQVVVFDAATLRVKSTWPLEPGETPTGLAFDAAGHRLFSVCENRSMVVLDSRTGHVLQTLPIGEGCDGVAFDSAARRVFASNGEGTLTVIGEDKPGHFAVIENVPTRNGARTLAVDPRTHRVYTATPRFGPAPEPTAERPHPRPTIVPGSFEVLVLEP